MEQPAAFEFINIYGTPKESRAVRSLARAHVMKEYRRSTKSKKEDALRRNSGSPEPKSELARNELNEADDTINTVSSKIPPNLPGSLDPFAEFPVQMKPRMYMLVKHYITELAPACSPTELGWFSWFQISIKDSALFHLVLLSAATHYHYLCGDIKSPEILSHKTKAIQLVNEKLKETEICPSDETIRAVALLAMTEQVSGNQKTWYTHMKGLSEMVKLRGGLDSLSRSLQQKICMAECYNCIELDTPPRLTFFISPSDPHLTPPLPPGFSNLPPSLTLDCKISSILRDFSSFINNSPTYDPNPSSPTPATESEDTGYNITSLRCRLLCAIPTNPISDACRLGALIALKTVLYQYPVSGQPYRIILVKVRRHLESMQQEMSNNRNMTVGADEEAVYELMLWLAFQGWMISLSGEGASGKKSWFLERIWEIAMQRLGLRGAVDLRIVLVRFLWVESRYARSCERLWEEVVWLERERMRRSLGLEN